MAVRTTVILDDDVNDRLRRQSRSKGVSFRKALNDLLRKALFGEKTRSRRRSLTIRPIHMGYKAGFDYDDIAALIEYGEGKGGRCSGWSASG
jgi:hypothetical protein